MNCWVTANNVFCEVTVTLKRHKWSADQFQGSNTQTVHLFLLNPCDNWSPQTAEREERTERSSYIYWSVSLSDRGSLFCWSDSWSNILLKVLLAAVTWTNLWLWSLSDRDEGLKIPINQTFTATFIMSCFKWMRGALNNNHHGQVHFF